MSSDPIEVDTLEQHFEDVIRAMDVRFTSHQFLLRLAHDHQCDYVAGLSAYAKGGKPFRDLHHALIQRLKKREGSQVKQRMASYPSQDIFGTPSHAGLWRKL